MLLKQNVEEREPEGEVEMRCRGETNKGKIKRSIKDNF
jgi:hypothetical protein